MGSSAPLSRPKRIGGDGYRRVYTRRVVSVDQAYAEAGATGRPDRRALLIDAARELFTERAYDEVTTSEIAKRAGVAYGLIAHHFTNKRGLYLATVNTVADRLRAVHEAPPEADTPAAMLREGILRHIAFVEENAEGYFALMHGGSGSDPEVRAIIEDFRWAAATRLMRMLGVREPFHPVLRTAMHGWSGCMTESLSDYLRSSDLPREDLATLVVRALIATLRAAHEIDSEIGMSPRLIDELAS